MAKSSAEIEKLRNQWHNTGNQRPDFAVEPKAGQESVWDYPRPAKPEPISTEVVVKLGDVLIAKTTKAVRVLETSHPPTYYLPPDDINFEHLQEGIGSSFCEWKGQAKYWNLVAAGQELTRHAWSYPDPFPEFASIRDFVAFYPRQLECSVDGQPVTPQPGQFYAGWITRDLVGPFKGEPGSEGW